MRCLLLIWLLLLFVVALRRCCGSVSQSPPEWHDEHHRDNVETRPTAVSLSLGLLHPARDGLDEVDTARAVEYE